MQTFEWIDATSIEHAAQLLAAGAARGPVIAKAGGMDLLDLMKEGIVAPARVVNLQTVAALRSVQCDRNGLRLGALTTLAQIETHPQIRASYPALAAAAGHAATPQVRNAATIGGNLLQRPRSWYFRNAHFHRSGMNFTEEEAQYGAIFDNSHSMLVHASTPATALIAYGATVELVDSQRNSHLLPLGKLLLPPDPKRDRDAAIRADQVLTQVFVPPPALNLRAAYHKQTERDSYDWPLCDVAVVLEMHERSVYRASIVMGWVAPTPRRAVESERLLAGRTIDERVASEAARAAVSGATPRAKNSYKVPVLEAVVRRTILAAAG